MSKPEIPYFFLSPAILVLCLFVATVAHAGEGGGRKQAWGEPGVDRPGADFKILWLRGGPGACQEACSRNPLCKSYTYVREGMAGRLEGCWLKDGVPPPVEDPCCISGVKTGEIVSRITGEPGPPAGETEGGPAIRDEARSGGSGDRVRSQEDHRGRYHGGSAATIMQGGCMNRAGSTVMTWVSVIFLLSTPNFTSAQDARGSAGLPSYIKSPADRPPSAGIEPTIVAPNLTANAILATVSPNDSVIVINGKVDMKGRG